MTSAAKKAKDSSSGETNVLKIFVAPEFFWQPQKGNYDAAHIKIICEKLAILAADDKYQHWMFVFGTMIGDGTQLPGGNLLPGNIHNIVYIQQGGRGGASYYSYKQHKSGIDFVLKEGTQDKGITIRSPYQDGLQLTLDNVPSLLGNNAPAFFTMCGIDFGLEVCLDHCCHFLKSNIGVKPRPSVHIITSCGMNITDTSVVARPGGLVLLCDGLSTYSATGVVSGNYSKVGKAILNPFKHTFKMPTKAMVMNTGLTGIELKVLGSTFPIDEFTPRLVIFPKLDLPGGDVPWGV